MKILQISGPNQTFNGLWSERKGIVGYDDYTTYSKIENFYYPFSDESKYSIDDAVKKKTYCVTCPGVNEFETEEITSSVKVMPKLTFTADEFNKYKRFYGKTLTEEFKKIESELRAHGLADSLNGGILYNFKKLLFQLKIIK